ncbi:MAG: GNAT family N-acetyltransferase [Clostridia bacterium]|nr:GNAT family N-acetyltransferase [Clostridia bacterium]
MDPKAKKLTTPEELVAHDMTCAIGFVGSQDMDQALQELIENKDKPRRDDTWGALDENGDIFATMSNNIYSVEFDGHIVAAGGVGGVSSMPEFRSKGGIRSIFREQFKEMYQKGFLLSYLFPFSHPYYRQFGYELSCTQAMYEVEIEALKNYRCDLNVYMCRKDDPLDDLKAVHAEFIKGKNLAIHRRDDQWWMAKGDPFKDRCYKYVFCDDNGKPRAYIIFRPTKNEKKGNWDARVKDIAYLAPDDLKQIFGFMYRLRAQYGTMYIELPEEVPMHSMVPECYDVEKTLAPHGQMRIICVQKALELMRCPEESGRAVIRVEDPFLEENTGTYVLNFAEGHAISVEKDDTAEPDIKLSIQRFSQLAIGFTDLAQATYLSDVQIIQNRDTLEKLFVQKPIFFTDHF